MYLARRRNHATRHNSIHCVRMHPTTIGPYTIERELGRGGMGQVFLARDTRLDRLVAIKALPEHLAQDQDRLSRFQREAKVLASLNHPGIGAIFGLEEVSGHHYLILEYIDGQTLAERLEEGAIGIEESLPLARQIADALEAAHDKGVVHRDLKPANIMITGEGAVKVLDFGLARTEAGAPTSTIAQVCADSPTLTSPVRVNSPTIPGVILGTAGYMSPEQARGKAVDKRSDIFSFGCVLYEMLTGAGPFGGETVTDSIGAILHREPEWKLIPPHAPARVRELLAACLTKDRRNRLHDIGDARLELERAIAGKEWASTAAAASAETQSKRTTIIAASAVALAAGGAIGWIVAGQRSRPAPAAAKQTFHVSATLPSTPRFNRLAAISPDATFVVYSAWPELESDSDKPTGVLVMRRLDRNETLVVEGTEGARNAAMSPDGRWVAYACARDHAGTKFTLKKFALENGRPSGKPQTVCDLANSTSFSVGWASDREIVYSTDLDATVFALAASGGEPRIVVKDESTENIEGWDGFRPLVTGQSLLATHIELVNEKIKVNVEVIELATGKRTVVIPGAGSPQIVSEAKDGEKLLVATRTDLSGLFAVRFDSSTLKTIGEPFTVWNGNTLNGLDISPSGTLAMTTQPTNSNSRRLAVLDDKGLPQSIAGTPRAFASIAISPDGGRVLFRLDSTTPDELQSEVWVQDLTRRSATRIPIMGFVDGLVWSNDGQRIAYGSFNTDEFSIWERPATPSGSAVKMHSIAVSQQLFSMPLAWSPDGRILAIQQTDVRTSKSDVLMIEQVQEAGETKWKAMPYLNSPADEHALRFSPDGKWVVFCSVESGRHELYVQRFTGATSGTKDAASGRVQISTTGHDGVVWWSRDGKEIRFIDGDKNVVSVEVKTEPAFSTSVPKVLYTFKDLKARSFSWTPEGQLMVVLPGENDEISKIDLIVNFADEVKAKMPARN